MSQIADLQHGKDVLALENTDLRKKYRDATTILNVVNAELSGTTVSDDLKQRLAQIPSGEILDLGVSIENNQNKIVTFVTKLVEHDSSAVDKYNALLADYKEYVQRVNIQLAQIGQANRVSNALALYNLMPKYTPTHDPT